MLSSFASAARSTGWPASPPAVHRERRGSADTPGTALDDVLRDAADAAGVPAVAGIPLGHVSDQWTIPLGARVELDADALTLHVMTD